MKNLDIRFADASPERHQSVMPPAEVVRFYESSYGGVSIVLYSEDGMKGAIRLSVEQVELLDAALGEYLGAVL